MSETGATPKKVIYVCGPISAKTKEERDANVANGYEAGVRIWRLGHVALVPHLNSDGMFEKAHIPAADIYLGDLVLLERCNAMFRLPGWENSYGCNYETAWAQHKQIPIFDKWEDLTFWLQHDRMPDHEPGPGWA
jgi:Domain of unknown function (DUF4406)